MTYTIILKRSATASSVPTVGAMQVGEAAINTFDGKMFILKNNGTPSIVEVGAQTLTGDITGSGNGNIPTTISNNAVTLTKFQTLPASTLLGNATGAIANAQTLTASQVVSLIGLNNVNNTADANKPVSTAQAAAIALSEVLSNKATSFTTLNNTLYPTTQAVATYVGTAISGVLADCGSYNPTVTSAYPTTGGTGAAGAIQKGNLWYISVAGTIGGVAVTLGDTVRALVNTPGQTAANWSILETNIGFAPYPASNPNNYTSVTTTNQLAEGTTNKYFTNARVTATPLTGLDTSVSASITATDTVLSSIGKLQALYTDLSGGVGAWGVWPINVGGTSGGIDIHDTGSDTTRSANLNPPYANAPRSIKYDFVTGTSAGGTTGYAGVMTLSPATGTIASGGGPSYQMAFNSTTMSSSGIPYLSIRNGLESAWGSWYTLVHNGNINDYLGGYLPKYNPVVTGLMKVSDNIQVGPDSSTTAGTFAIRVSGPTIGDGAGSYVGSQIDNSNIIAIGNTSSLVGGVFSAVPMIWANGPISINNTINVSGNITATGSVNATGAVTGDSATFTGALTASTLTTSWTIRASGQISTTGSMLAGTSTATLGISIAANGNNTGNAAGAALLSKNGNVAIIAIGNYSVLLGGAYDATPTIWANAPIKVTQPVNITGGGLSVSGDVTASTGVVIPNANYLKSKTATDTLTRCFGLDASNILSIGSLDTAIAGVNINSNGTTWMSFDATGNASIGGNLAVTKDITVAGAISSTLSERIPLIDTGYLLDAGFPTVTGAIKIRFPVGYTNSAVSFKVDISTGAANAGLSIVVGGYNFKGTPNGWSNTFAYQIGSTASKLPNVRFGFDGTYCCVWIGELATVWNYLNVFISDFNQGRTTNMGYIGAWGISTVTAFNTVDATVTPSLVITNDALTPTFTNAVTLLGGIKGAASPATLVGAGLVGETVTATGTGISMGVSNAAGVNITSISLTAGVWNVSGNIAYTATSPKKTFGSISSVSAGVTVNASTFSSTGGVTVFPTGTTLLRLTATTTIYLVGICTATVAPTATGTILAMRIR